MDFKMQFSPELNEVTIDPSFYKRLLGYVIEQIDINNNEYFLEPQHLDFKDNCQRQLELIEANTIV